MFACVALLTSCGDKETEGISSSVFLTKIVLNEGGILVWEYGKEFVDPGYVATDNEVPVDETVLVEGLDDVDVNAEGLYEVTYSAISKDGFETSIVRKVIVIEGEVSDVDLTGKYSGGSSSYGMFSPTKEVCRISMLAPGVFEATDFFCGHYTEGRGLSSRYKLSALFKLNPDNTYTVFETDSPWGPWGIANTSYDPVAKRMDHEIIHSSGFSFTGTLILIPEED